MPKLLHFENAEYLKDFGQGTTKDADKAHDFTSDEAEVLMALCPALRHSGGTDTPTMRPNMLDRFPGPPADPNMIWVWCNGEWMLAEKQHLFMATRIECRKRAEAKGLAL